MFRRLISQISLFTRIVLITLLCLGLVVFSRYLLFLDPASHWPWYLLLGIVWLVSLILVSLPRYRPVPIPNVDDQLERRFLMDTLGEHSPVVYIAVDRDGIIIEAGGSALADAGMQPTKVLGKSILALVKNDFQLTEDVQRALAGEHFTTERQFAQRFYRHHFFPNISRAGEMLGYSCISIDQTQERKLNAEIDLLRKVLQNTTDAISVSNSQRQVIGVNPAFTTITGYALQEVLGKKAGIPSPEIKTPGFYRDIFRQLKTRGVWQGEVWARRKNGDLYSANLTISVIRDNGAIAHYVCVFSDTTDITDIRRSQEELKYLVNHDQLTGLPNRRLFMDRLEQAMKRAKRLGNRLAVYFVDIDNFKLINDSLGHQFGDEVLKSVGSRVQQAMRDVDTVARLAGDEFTVIAENIEDNEQVISLGQKILRCFDDEFAANGQSLEVSASIGVGVYPDHGEDMLTLMDGADTAMYKAKSKGRNGFFYLAETAPGTAFGKVQYSELRLAIRREQIELFYQPLHDLVTGAIVGGEALLRWNHPTLGLLAPQHFLAMAEEKGMIHEIGNWVAHEVCGQFNLWREQKVQLDFISMNLAAMQLESEDFLCTMQDAMEVNQLNPGAIVMEIPERVALADQARSRRFLDSAMAQGLICAIDDFGASNESLLYLRDLPVAMVKLDQKLLFAGRSPNEARFLLNALVTLAELLGLKLLGVGIEHSREETLLRELGCRYGQGYLYARPMSVAEFRVYYQDSSRQSEVIPGDSTAVL